MENKRSAAVIVSAVGLAAGGLWLFWIALGSDNSAAVALGAFGLVLGLTATGAALKRVVGVLSPGVLADVEYDEWLEASAEYREPGPFRVVLEAAGDKQIDAVKVIREVTGSDVGRAIDMAERTPTPVAQGVSAESAELIAERFRGVGASVRVEDGGKNPGGRTPL